MTTDFDEEDKIIQWKKKKESSNDGTGINNIRM